MRTFFLQVSLRKHLYTAVLALCFFLRRNRKLGSLAKRVCLSIRVRSKNAHMRSTQNRPCKGQIGPCRGSRNAATQMYYLAPSRQHAGRYMLVAPSAGLVTRYCRARISRKSRLLAKVHFLPFFCPPCFFKGSNPCGHTHKHTCAHAIPLPTHDTGKGAGRWLSPFNLPVTKADVNGELRSEEKVSENIENYWQAGKVYRRVVTHTVTNSKDGKKYTRWHQNKEEHARLNEQGEWVVNAQWEAWRTRLLAHPYAVRRPNGSVKKGGVPLFSMHEGKQLDYVSSRKAVYLPVYTSAVRRHPFYQEILAKVRSGKSVMLIDVDGPDRVAFPNGLEMSPERLVEALHDTKRPFGHGYACAWALMEDAQL
jgi:hypothetical protein